MSVLADQDVQSFNSPVIMKRSLNEADKEAQSKRSIRSPGDDVIKALETVLAAKNNLTKAQWGYACEVADKLYTPTGMHI
jgi:hypothetical protein